MRIDGRQNAAIAAIDPFQFDERPPREMKSQLPYEYGSFIRDKIF